MVFQNLMDYSFLLILSILINFPLNDVVMFGNEYQFQIGIKFLTIVFKLTIQLLVLVYHFMERKQHQLNKT